MALKFFSLPAAIWGGLTYCSPQRTFEAIRFFLLKSILSAVWYSLWTTSHTENLRLILVVAFQASFGIHDSTRDSQSAGEKWTGNKRPWINVAKQSPSRSPMPETPCQPADPESSSGILPPYLITEAAITRHDSNLSLASRPVLAALP